MDSHKLHEPLSAHDVDMSKSSFTKASLAESRFDDVNLRGARVTNANLSGVVLDDVNLTGVSISNANVTDMRINGILIGDLMRAYRSMAGAVLYAKDVPRLRRFYEKVLGLEVETAHATHVDLVAPAFRLTLVEIPAHISSAIEIVEPPRLRSESPTKLVFAATSIAAVRARAREHGGDVLPPEREWELESRRQCDGNDPEGNVFQVREVPA